MNTSPDPDPAGDLAAIYGDNRLLALGGHPREVYARNPEAEEASIEGHAAGMREKAAREAST